MLRGENVINADRQAAAIVAYHSAIRTDSADAFGCALAEEEKRADAYKLRAADKLERHVDWLV